jgi:PadR family transcriptional regulator, regulatory protein PadR
MILQAIHAGRIYGFGVMEVTGLPSGTVYPAMRRLQRDDLITSRWKRQSIADAEQRPLRRYYKLTKNGRTALDIASKRYPLLTTLIPSAEVETREDTRAGPFTFRLQDSFRGRTEFFLTQARPVLTIRWNGSAKDPEIRGSVLGQRWCACSAR